MKKNLVFGLLSIFLLFFILSFTIESNGEEKNNKAIHCYEFRVTPAGKSGFYDTVEASSWGEATKKISAKYPNCKATQVKQKDC